MDTRGAQPNSFTLCCLWDSALVLGGGFILWPLPLMARICDPLEDCLRAPGITLHMDTHTEMWSMDPGVYVSLE